MLRDLYNWTMRLAGRRHAGWALAGVSFAESSFFPIPPDIMLAPMVLARPDRAWRLAFICSVASVIGGLGGYAIGYFLYETIGGLLVSLYGLQNGMEQFHEAYAEWGLWIILIKGLTPIPYKLVTIASGLARFDLGVFILASIVTRSARFFLVAALLKYFGPSIRHFVESYLTWVTTGILVVTVAGILAVKFLF